MSYTQPHASHKAVTLALLRAQFTAEGQPFGGIKIAFDKSTARGKPYTETDLCFISMSEKKQIRSAVKCNNTHVAALCSQHRMRVDRKRIRNKHWLRAVFGLIELCGILMLISQCVTAGFPY